MPRDFYKGRNIRPAEILARNHRHAVARGFPWFKSSPPREGRIAIVGGGASADLAGILAFDGPIIAVNGAYDWLCEAGRVPDYMAMADPDAAMAAFVQKPRKGTTFLIATSCDPSVFRALRRRDVRLWKARQGNEDTTKGAIPGGPSMMCRAPILAMFMGWREIHLCGADSCFTGPTTHVYGGDIPADAITVNVAGLSYLTTPALVMQAEHLAGLLRMANDVEWHIKGTDHLLSRMLATGQDWQFDRYVPPNATPAHISEALRAVPSSWRNAP